MRQKPKIIHEWTEPAKIRVREARQLLRQAKVAIPRILAITLIVEVAIYFIWTTLIPEPIQQEMDFPWFRFCRNGFIAALVFVSIMYLMFIVLARYYEQTYKITQAGVQAMGNRSWSVPWNAIGGYSLSENEHLPEVCALILYMRKGVKRLFLPEGEQAQEIIATIRQDVPLIDPAPDLFKKPELSIHEYAVIGLFFIGYNLLFAGLLLLSYFYRNLIFVAAIVAYGTLLFGPGTISFVVLFGRLSLRRPPYRLCALAINLVAWSTLFLMAIAYGLICISLMLGGL